MAPRPLGFKGVQSLWTGVHSSGCKHTSFLEQHAPSWAWPLTGGQYASNVSACFVQESILYLMLGPCL